MFNEKWDRRFLALAHQTASWSKDPKRKVGCVIVDADRIVLAGGYNGFPRGVADTPERYADLETKLSMIVHAEANAIASAASKGHRLRGAAAYITRPPCAQCAALLIQAGISSIVFEHGVMASNWYASWAAIRMLNEAGVRWQGLESQQEQV